jgi:hypothetical protein
MSRTKRPLRPSLFLCFLLFSSFFSSLCSLPLHTLNTPSLLHSHSLIHYSHSLIHFTLLLFELSLRCPISIHCPAGLSFQLDSPCIDLLHPTQPLPFSASASNRNDNNKQTKQNIISQHTMSTQSSSSLVKDLGSFFLSSQLGQGVCSHVSHDYPISSRIGTILSHQWL